MQESITGNVEGRKAKLLRFLADGFTPLKNDFDNLFRKSWCEKFSYPFKAPMLVIICLVYAVLQLTFIICAAQAVDEMGVVITHVLNGGGWVVYYLFAVIVGAIANLYVFLVAGLWVAIITAVLAAIAVVVAGIALICLLAICASGSGFNRNKNYVYT